MRKRKGIWPTEEVELKRVQRKKRKKRETEAREEDQYQGGGTRNEVKRATVN